MSGKKEIASDEEINSINISAMVKSEDLKRYLIQHNETIKKINALEQELKNMHEIKSDNSNTDAKKS